MAAYRHECKHEINTSDFITLSMRLNAALKADEFARADGAYEITSLYFDDVYDTALKEKLNGVNCRDKFRLRRYNNDTEHIKLEKKSKRGGLCLKECAAITAAQAQSIIGGDIDFLAAQGGVMAELYSRMRAGLMPKTIVRYTRSAYTYPAGNVRITLDYDIRTSPAVYNFLNADAVCIPACGGTILLEVKWDEFLPDFIADLIFIPGRRSGSFSKYAQCRIYG